MPTQEARSVRKNALVVVRGAPHRVAEVRVTRFGKHGWTKHHLSCVDVATGVTTGLVLRSHHPVEVPVERRADYEVVFAYPTGRVGLLDAVSGSVRTDLPLPDSFVGEEVLQALVEHEEAVMVTVQTLEGLSEQIVAMRVVSDD